MCRDNTQESTSQLLHRISPASCSSAPTKEAHLPRTNITPACERPINKTSSPSLPAPLSSSPHSKEAHCLASSTTITGDTFLSLRSSTTRQNYLKSALLPPRPSRAILIIHLRKASSRRLLDPPAAQFVSSRYSFLFALAIAFASIQSLSGCVLVVAALLMRPNRACACP